MFKWHILVIPPQYPKNTVYKSPVTKYNNNNNNNNNNMEFGHDVGRLYSRRED